MYPETDTDILTSVLLASRHLFLHPHFEVSTDLGRVTASPDHPPGMMLMLDASVRLCKLLNPGPLRNGPLLNACINLPPALFALGIALLVWKFSRDEKLHEPLYAFTAFWLNPALILATSVLGYQDSMFAFFGLLALILFYGRRYSWSALALACSCLSKPEGMFLIPVLATAAWADGRWRELWRYAIRGGLFALIALLPYALAHHLLALFAHVASLITDPWLSGQELNAWWLVGPLLNWVSGHAVFDSSGIIAMYRRADFTQWAGIDPRWIADFGLGIFVFMGLRKFFSQMKQGNRLALFWAGALVIYGFTMLSVFVHENHLHTFFVYAAPLLALPARIFKRFYFALSIIFAANLYLFEGFGQNVRSGMQWGRILPGFDITIVIAVANITIFLVLLRTRHWGFDLTTKNSSPAPMVY
jgi:hypothetical protein